MINITSLTTIKIGILLLGLLFTFIGYIQRRHFNNFEKTTGIIVKREKTFNISLTNITSGEDIQTEKSTDPDSYASFQFVVNNKQYEGRSLIKINPGYAPGSKVDILYNPDNPKKAIISNIFYKGFYFFLGGAFILIISLLLFWFI